MIKPVAVLSLVLMFTGVALADNCKWRERSSLVAEKVWEIENCTVYKYSDESLGINVRKPKEVSDAFERNVTHSMRFTYGSKKVDDYYLTLAESGRYIVKKIEKAAIEENYFENYCLPCAKELPPNIVDMFGGYLDILEKF